MRIGAHTIAAPVGLVVETLDMQYKPVNDGAGKARARQIGVPKSV